MERGTRSEYEPRDRGKAWGWMAKAGMAMLCLSGVMTGADADPGQDAPHVEPFVEPKLAPQKAPPAEKAEAIESLIGSLQDISRPDFGLSPTLGGSDFPPVPDQAQAGCMILTAHDLQRSDALTRLVELGPAALPALMRHIADRTPTKLVIKHDLGFGAMWYATELPWNPASALERKALQGAGLLEEREQAEGGRVDGQDIQEHTIAVGDVCFLIIGMISNREYQAVRYQPTACVVINSPIERPALAKAVTTIWSTENSRLALFRSLLIDFHTQDGSGQRPCGAATRLLYYFPEEAAPVVTERIRSFAHTKEGDARNDVSEPAFLKAVAWHPDPSVREAIRQVIGVSDDVELVVSGAPAMTGTPPDPFCGKLVRMLLGANHGFGYPSREPQGLLNSIAILYPAQTTDAVQRYLEHGGRESLINVVFFLGSHRIAGASELMTPVLADQSSGVGSYLKDGVIEEKQRYKEADYLPMRMCDNAYVIICRALGDADAWCTGSAAEMDTRIAALQTRLKQGLANARFTAEEIQARVQDRRKVALALQDERARDERTYLLQHALPVDPGEEWPDEKMIKAIAEKYPTSLPTLYANLLRTHPHLQSHPVVELILRSGLNREVKIAALLAGAQHAVLEHRRAALFALHELTYVGFTDLVIDALRHIPKRAEAPCWQSKAGPFAILAILANEAKAWTVLTEIAIQVDIGTRLEMLNVMNYQVVDKLPLAPRIAFLVGFLDDAGLRELAGNAAYDGPCAGFVFPRLEVRDFAAMQLESLLDQRTKPDSAWTSGQWADFRAQVRKAVEGRSSKQDGGK